MPDGVTIQLVGDVDLIRKLDRLEARDAKKAVRRGTRAGAKIIKPIVVSMAPKKSGILRQAIRVRATKRSRKFIGAVVQMGAGWFKGPTFYGAFQEWGWKSRSGREIPGKLFMQRATKYAGRQAAARAVTVIRDEIEQAARR